MTTVEPPQLADGRWPTAPCSASSCGAPVVWAYTERGKTMPVDAQPSPIGSLELVDRGERTPLARFVPVEARLSTDALHTSHFVTCAKADSFRRRPRHA